MKHRLKRLALVLAATTMLAACSGAYTRGIFRAMSSTRPKSRSRARSASRMHRQHDPDAPRWTYTRKTFDPETRTGRMRRRSSS